MRYKNLKHYLYKAITLYMYFFCFQFGCSLVDLFLKSAQININLFNNRPERILPAFYHTYEFKVNKKLGVLKPHPIVCKLFKGYLARQGEISMETTSVPMLVPPRPWRATKDGAYLILPGMEIGNRQSKVLERKRQSTYKQETFGVFKVSILSAWTILMVLVCV